MAKSESISGLCAKSDGGRRLRRLSLEDDVEEFGQPGSQRRVEQHAAFKMFAALLGVRQDEAMGAMHDPAMHHRPGQFGMELQPPGVAVVAEGLVRIGIAFGQEVGAARQFEALAVE